MSWFSSTKYYLEDFDGPKTVCIVSLFPQTQRYWGKLVLLAFVFLCITWFTGGLLNFNELLRLRLWAAPVILLSRVWALIKLCDRSKPRGRSGSKCPMLPLTHSIITGSRFIATVLMFTPLALKFYWIRHLVFEYILGPDGMSIN